MVMLYTVTYTKSDNPVHLDETIAIDKDCKSVEDAINCVIKEFYTRHNMKENLFICGVHKESVSFIASYLKDIVEEFSKGSLVFTDNDANAVSCAITLLETIKEG